MCYGILPAPTAIGIPLALLYCAFSPNNCWGLAMNITGTMENALLRRPLSTEMAELSLLLPSWQMRELADTADATGLTVGQLMRGFIQQVLQSFPKKTENGFDSSNTAI